MTSIGTREHRGSGGWLMVGKGHMLVGACRRYIRHSGVVLLVFASPRLRYYYNQIIKLDRIRRQAHAGHLKTTPRWRR